MATHSLPLWLDVFVILITVGTVFLTVCWPIYREVKWRKRPSVSGTILSAAILVSARALSVSSNAKALSYTPALRYAYAVGGVRYESSAIVPISAGLDIGVFRTGMDFHTEAEAQAVLERFPVGSTVPVHYDPAKPSDAVLIRTNPALYHQLGIGAFVSAILCLLVDLFGTVPRLLGH